MFGFSTNKSIGAILLDGKQVADVYICCHCGKHFTCKYDAKKNMMVNPGGHVRSFCVLCNAPTCGRSECNGCEPFEKKLDEYEKGIRKELYVQ